MILKQVAEQYLPALELELRRQISRLDAPPTAALYEMLGYHMGWAETGSSVEPTGKRIRPLIVLLVAQAVGGRWQASLPAAAAVEIVHNFSLVHDDIQDNSPTRRGRPAVWTKYGTGMAINVGDALFSIAHQAVLDLRANYDAATVLKIARILQEACLDLTRGQYMDLAYQRRIGLSIQDYWLMIEGKTAALLAAGAQIGAVAGGADAPLETQYRTIGRLLGLAFQVQDDMLGIWGDEALTGKSVASDLVEGKSSLPVLYAMSKDPAFAQRWISAPVRTDEVTRVARFLRDAGAYDYSVGEGKRLTDQALATLRSVKPQGEAGEALFELTQQLLGRTS